MKTPREILLRQHQNASPKLDTIRAEVVAGMTRTPTPERISWWEMVRSLRWHLAGMSAAWVVVIILNLDHSPNAVAMMPRDKIPSAQQIWASLREHRRLLMEFGDAGSPETPAVPGRRSELEPRQVVV